MRQGSQAELARSRPAPREPGRSKAAAQAGNRPRSGRAGSARLAELARGGTLNLAGAGVAAVMTLGMTVLITRHFSKYAAGSFFAATSAFLIVEMVATLGVQNGLVYFTARLRSLGEDDRIPATLRIALTPVVVVSVALMLVMLLLAQPLAHLLLSSYHKGPTGAVGEVAVALRWLAILVPFGALETALLGASRGYHDMRPTVVVDRIGVSTAQLLAVLAAVAAGSAAFLAPLWALPYVPPHRRRHSAAHRPVRHGLPKTGARGLAGWRGESSPGRTAATSGALPSHGVSRSSHRPSSSGSTS
jgi:hypothetical protein